MIINKLVLKNFSLFKNQELSIDRINLINGINYDSLKENEVYPGNGSGKTTIISAILFGLFGEVTGLNLKDLIRTETKECSVELTFTIDKDTYRIFRRIPNLLRLFKNEIELIFNTPTICQAHIQSIIETDFQHYRTYNIIDNKKGINLLDLGVTSLRKALMDFVNEQFIIHRQNLLNKKLERENLNINKRLYKFYLSDKKLNTLEQGLEELKLEEYEALHDKTEQEKIINDYKADIRTKEGLIYNRQNELATAQKSGICPILKKKCIEITKSITAEQKDKINIEINSWQEEIKELKNILINEEECLKSYVASYSSIQCHVQRVESYIMKLKEAQKFSNYKYTEKDVQLYADSIKIFDSFASYYISTWLSNLTIILNDLLKDINLSVEFSIDKNFIKINDNGKEFNYSQLSSGQKAFLGTIFKIGILLQEGISEGTLIFDEGLGDIDSVNLIKLINILKNLNFQCLIIYQNCPKDLKDINYIDVVRKNGESNARIR